VHSKTLLFTHQMRKECWVWRTGFSRLSSDSFGL